MYMKARAITHIVTSLSSNIIMCIMIVCVPVSVIYVIINYKIFVTKELYTHFITIM